jgi:hypothetical protein
MQPERSKGTLLSMGAPRVEVIEGKRKCSNCGDWKTLKSEFYWDKTEKRYRSACKECIRLKSKVFHQKNREVVIEKQRQRRKRRKAADPLIDKKRLDKIKNHDDPDLVPWREWRSTLDSFKSNGNYRWSEMEDFLGLPGTLQNQYHGKVWPPTHAEAKRILSELQNMPSRRVSLQEWREIIEGVLNRDKCSHRDIDRMLGWTVGRVSEQLRGSTKRPCPLRSELPVLLEKLGLDKKSRVGLESWRKAVHKICTSKGLTVARVEGLFGLPDGMLVKQLLGEVQPPLLEDAEWMLRRAAGLPVRPKEDLDQTNIYMPDGSVYVRLNAAT